MNNINNNEMNLESFSNNQLQTIGPSGSVMDGIILKTQLETEADINALSTQLLTIVNKCIPLATEAYESNAKKSNADALNLFISQSRELTNDIRSQHNKKIQTNKILKECLSPIFQKILDHMQTIPSISSQLTKEEYEEELRNFMFIISKQVAEKLKEIL